MRAERVQKNHDLNYSSWSYPNNGNNGLEVGGCSRAALESQKLRLYRRKDRRTFILPHLPGTNFYIVEFHDFRGTDIIPDGKASGDCQTTFSLYRSQSQFHSHHGASRR